MGKGAACVKMRRAQEPRGAQAVGRERMRAAPSKGAAPSGSGLESPPLMLLERQHEGDQVHLLTLAELELLDQVEELHRVLEGE